MMVLSTALFALMGVCVKIASQQYSTGEIVFYRGLIGALVISAFTMWRGGSLRTGVPAMHAWRSLTGVTALSMWFYAIGNLPLATAMTLNYMSSIWMGLFLLGGALMFSAGRVDGRLILALLLGFGGVALILRPTIEQDQLWHGLIGLLSGVISAMAYLQVTALGRVGEPEYRVVFYFSLGGMIVGAGFATTLGWHGHDARGIGLLIAVGLLATAAQLLMTRAYATGRPLVNASLAYLGIAWAFIFGVLLFDERVTWHALVGMTLIVGAGVAATLLRNRAAPASPGPSTEY